MEFQLLLLLTTLGICTLPNSATSTEQPIYFSLVVSSAPTLNTLKIVPAINRTLELVRKNVILPGYHLQYSHLLDVQVSSKLKASSLF